MSLPVTILKENLYGQREYVTKRVHYFYFNFSNGVKAIVYVHCIVDVIVLSDHSNLFIL